MSTNNNWKPLKEYQEILFDTFEGIGRITINRPQVHNAFTPLTVSEMSDAMNICREDTSIGVWSLPAQEKKPFVAAATSQYEGTVVMWVQTLFLV